MNKGWYILFFLGFFSPLKSQDLYDVSRIQEIKIYFDDPYWDNKLNAYKKQGLNKRIIAKVKLNGVTYDSVGVRYKGNSSYFNTRKEGSTKLPFNIKFNHIKKSQRLPDGSKRLKLSNVFRDPSYLREVLSYEIIGNYMPSPRANYARLYVNDEYLGFYNSTSSVDSLFLKEKFGEDNGALIKCDPAWKAKTIAGCKPNQKSTLVYLGKDSSCYYNSYELKSDHGWTPLLHLTDVLNNKTDKIETILNVDQTLWMLAFNSVVVNLDSYTGRLSHNYYIYQDSSGIFNPIMWDMNMSFGGFRFDGSGRSLNDEQLQTLSPFLHYKSKNADRPLISKLLANNLYRKIYLGHMHTIMNDYFINGKYKERAKAIQRIIDRDVQNDKNKLYAYEGFPQNLERTAMAGSSKIIGLTELMDKRVAYLKNHVVFQKAAPTIDNVRHVTSSDGIRITVKVNSNQDKSGKLLPVYVAFKNSKNGVWQRIEMVDDGTQNDGVANDQVYGLTIEKVANTAYYIIAEGERVAKVSPEKASFEFYKVP